MKSNKIIEILRGSGRAAFRTKEFVALAQNPAYARLHLHRLHKKGVLFLVHRGWWAFSDAMHEAVACEISTPAYVSFHTALHLHGLTTQPHRTIQLAVTRNAKKYQVLGTPVQEYRVPKNQFRAYEKKDNLFLATPEKAVADAISIPKSCPAAIIMEALAHVKAGKIPPYLSSAAANKRLKNLMRHA